jgi:deoxyribose-phosphate aldolase
VAGGFPSADAPLQDRVAEVKGAVRDGAEEIDMVIAHPLVAPGRYGDALDELAAIREASGEATLKVILETGLLSGADVYRAALLAAAAGADFVKSSTGKREPGATLGAAAVMCDAVRDFASSTGKRVGVKVAGGIRTTDDAVGFVAVARGELGAEWLTPDRFRIGASTLLDSLVEELAA